MNRKDTKPDHVREQLLTYENQAGHGNEKRKQILKKVRDITLSNLPNGNIQVYLFGSWLRGQEATSSDIDIAIYYEGSLPPGTLAQLRMAFDESTLPYTVEVVDLTQTDPDFRQEIKKEGQLWAN